MKVLTDERANLEDCLAAAQRERVVITRKGKPIALVVGVKGLDLEQIELGHSDAFWKLIRQRRQQKSISREELERRLKPSRKKK